MKRGQYKTVSYSEQVRLTVAQMMVGMAQHNIPSAVRFDVAQEFFPLLAKSTLYRYMQRIEDEVEVFASVKASGATRKLSEQQAYILAGFVFVEEEKKTPVDFSQAKAWIQENFSVELTQPTIARYLKQFALKLRQVRVRTTGKKLDGVGVQMHAYEFVLNVHENGWMHRQLYSIDATYTSHRRDVRYALGVRGGNQPEGGKNLSPFTNCIMTLVSRNPKGQGRVHKPVLFSSNRAFDQRRRTSAQREIMAEYGVEEEQIVFVPDGNNYLRESTDTVAHAMKLWKVQRDSIIFSDQGRSFWVDGQSVLSPDFTYEHVPYPAPAHHLLSPNDNKYHSGPKRQWRAAFKDFRDDFRCSLYLVSALQNVPGDQVGRWFDKNFLLSVKKPELKHLDSLVKSWNPKMADRYSLLEECKMEYLAYNEASQAPQPPVKKRRAN